MAAETLDLTIIRNDSYQFRVEVTEAIVYNDSDDDDPVDLTNYTFEAQIRRTYDSTVVLANASVDSSDAANGNLVIAFHSSETDLYFPDGTGVWDLQITDDSATPLVTTTHRGTVTIVDDVTR